MPEFPPWRVRRWYERQYLAAMRFLPAQDEIPVSDSTPAATLLAVGDLSLWDAVERAFLHGPSSLLKTFSDVLRGCDLRIANLESVLTTAERPSGAIGTFLKASPASVRVLSDCGFDAVTVANNHALDYGPEGLLESLDVLDRHGIRHCGGGGTLAGARQPAILEANGVRVGMLGYCDECRSAAGAAVSPAEENLILEDIRLLRPRVDLLVVQLHWGYEFVLYPLLRHRERARCLAAAGADLVLCHHAHVPMGLEIFGRSLIVYGLGNFLFTLPDPASQGHPWTDRTFALLVRFGKDGISSAGVVPCGIRPDYSVCPLTGPARAEVLGALTRLSRRLLDTRWLASIERDCMLREGFLFVNTLARFRLSAPAKLREWAERLQTLRQRELITSLLESALARPVGEFLARLAECPGNALAMAAEIDCQPLRGALAEVVELARLPVDPPGRIP